MANPDYYRKCKKSLIEGAISERKGLIEGGRIVAYINRGGKETDVFDEVDKAKFEKTNHNI